jgi:uncharacterized 2Fe-2S/4Fe-4S cluster protein (DUF4445 family)
MTDKVTISFQEAGSDEVVKSIDVAIGTTMLDAAAEAGLDIDATCGRRGKCRSCRVKVLSGKIPPATLQDTLQLGHEAVAERFRLACQTRLIGDCSVMAVPLRTESGHQILSAGERSAVSDVVIESGVEKHLIKAEAPEDENEHTSDFEKIVEGALEALNLTPSLDVLRRIPETLREDKKGLTLTTFLGHIVDIEPGDTTQAKYGMAFDIGTTSIVGSLVDLSTGESMASVGGVNPQAVFGGDLMSRISYAQFDTKKLATLRGRVLTSINDFIKEACEKADVPSSQIYKVVVAGNTCMHHMFLGIDTSYVGLAPYAPVMRKSIVLPARDIPLKQVPNAYICLLPIIAGFVGADTIAAILATRIHESDEIRVIADIGTNGEMVMGSKKGLMACSAPAGPALEGGQILHGMRAALGAVEAISIDDDIHCEVVGNTPAIGICGSGLIDAAAKMLDANVLLPSGRYNDKKKEELSDKLAKRFIRDKDGLGFVLVTGEESGKGEDIILTQMDIRQLQLAKAAIYSGILMLQEVMEVADEDISELMVAGGFGNFVNLESAVRIALLPALSLDKFTYVGNAAHIGAELALLSESERLQAEEIAANIEHVALATRMEYQDLFVHACKFGVD